MAKKQRKNPRPRRQSVPTTAELEQHAGEQSDPSARWGRETVDALVIAVVLAFLIRTFQAEPFVIPTGSMAPTLMGAHKDVYCDQCEQRFRVNASEEGTDTQLRLQSEVNRGRLTVSQAQRELKAMEIVGGVCPECRYVMPIRADRLEGALPPGVESVTKRPTYSGDRLVVSKCAYSFADPERWDVIVFKYPGNATTNYIKRLVGLSNESLRVYQGDLFAKPSDSGEEVPHAIARKPADKVMAMRQLVHDTRRDPKRLVDAGWPLRWSDPDGGWLAEVGESGRNAPQSYRAEAPEEETRWLRYRHTIPTEPVWNAVLRGDEDTRVASAARPTLVTDFTAYNTRVDRRSVASLRQFSQRPLDNQEHKLGRLGVHWVGDLMVEADLRIESAEGRIKLDLVEAGEHYRCVIDVVTGAARCGVIPFEGGEDALVEIASAKTSIRGAGRYAVRFANFDDQLLLWIDGRLVDWDGSYEVSGDRRDRLPRTSEADPGDLSPAGVGVEGGSLAIDRLRVFRDLYYIADSWRRPRRSFVTDLDLDAIYATSDGAWSLLQLPSDPQLWPLLANRRDAVFTTGEDQFFMMGDNSAESLDSRLWAGGNQRDPGRPGGAYLERSQLVGKAVCVYWPHAWYTVPFLKFRDNAIPAWPNFADMRLVR